MSDADWDKLARRPRRWPKRLAVFLILVAVVVAALPTVVAKTPLRNVILSAVLPKNSVQVAIGDLSLGWFSRAVGFWDRSAGCGGAAAGGGGVGAAEPVAVGARDELARVGRDRDHAAGGVCGGAAGWEQC